MQDCSARCALGLHSSLIMYFNIFLPITTNVRRFLLFFSYVIRFEIYLFRRDLGNHHPWWPADHQQHTYISRLSKDQRRHAHAYIALSTHALDLVQLMLLIYITYAAKHTVWTPPPILWLDHRYMAVWATIMVLWTGFEYCWRMVVWSNYTEEQQKIWTRRKK